MAKSTGGTPLRGSRIAFTIEGVAPLMMNRCGFIEPDGLRNKKTEQERLQTARNEWREKLYLSPEIGLYVPSDWLEGMLRQSAAKWKLGKEFLASVFCTEMRFPLELPGGATVKTEADIERLDWIDRRNVVIKRSRVGRSRPMIPAGWRLTAQVTVLIAGLHLERFGEYLDYGGSKVGLGDYRPKFGRFVVEDVREAM